MKLSAMVDNVTFAYRHHAMQCRGKSRVPLSFREQLIVMLYRNTAQGCKISPGCVAVWV